MVVFRQLVLGLMILFGGLQAAHAGSYAEGVEAYGGGRYKEAFSNWLEAAKDGNVDAQNAVAGLYEHGLGVPRSLRKAAHWYQQAARQGNPDAQLTIGLFYREGRGVHRNPVRAYAWFKKATASGQKEAAYHFKALDMRLSDAEKERAQTIIRHLD